MNDLPHSPTPIAVRCVELGVAESAHSGPQLLRQLPQRLNLSPANDSYIAHWRAEMANWIAKIVRFCHGRNITTLAGLAVCFVPREIGLGVETLGLGSPVVERLALRLAVGMDGGGMLGRFVLCIGVGRVLVQRLGRPMLLCVRNCRTGEDEQQQDGG
jgi:hypothetical protein